MDSSSSGGPFKLSSMILADGAMFPAATTCLATTTHSQSPDLEWTGVPTGTMSFALALIDTYVLGDSGLPASEGYHYVMWDIPGSVTSLPMNLPSGSPPMGISDLTGSMQKNPTGPQYLGPCPNSGSGSRTDTYELRLYAFSTATQNVMSSQSTQQIIQALEALPNLGVAVLHGTSNAAGTLK